MSNQVFPTRWDFLFAQVLIGVDRTTGVFSGSEPVPGQQMVAVWTSEAVATEALHVESWELRPIAVRDLLAVLPEGFGVVVDPERSTGMTASPAYVANLRPLLVAFPVGAAVRITDWDELTGPARDDVVSVAARHETLTELHAFVYTVDDSPPLGCLVYTLGDGAEHPAGLVEALEQAVAAGDDLAVARVSVLGMPEVPAELRAALPDGYVIHRRRRRRPWRR